MPTTTIAENKHKSMWMQAIQDAEARIAKLDRERNRLKRAITLMRRQLSDGISWPTGTAEERIDNPDGPPGSDRE